MTKQKKSFLDKIINTGGDKDTEEKERAELYREEDSNGEKKVASDENESCENEKITEKDSREDYDGKSYNVAVEKDDKKEWFQDKEDIKEEEEGQLTIDVYQSKDSIIIKSIVGGVKAEDLDISVTADMITIKGKRINPDDVKADNYYYQECFWGNFSRSVILPCDIKTDEVRATMKNGILTVKLPKIEKNSSMKIEVKEE